MRHRGRILAACLPCLSAGNRQAIQPFIRLYLRPSADTFPSLVSKVKSDRHDMY